MTKAIIITIFASFLGGITNHIDKLMINGVDESGKSVKTMMIFSSLIAGLVFTPVWLVFSKFSVSISMVSLISVFLAAAVYVLAAYFYFKALDNNDASIVVTMFQLIPVFSYIISLIFFKENLTIQQIIGAIIIILSAVIISFDFKEKNNKSKFIALLLMTLSSLFFAIYYILFDVAIRNSPYNSCAFWYQVGLLLMGIILMCVKNYRNTFIKAIKTNGKTYFTLNMTNEGINLIANLLINFANLTIPIALANVLSGFQGAFVFILGVIGVKLLPKYFKEDLTKNIVLQKVSCIVLSVVGLIVMFM